MNLAIVLCDIFNTLSGASLAWEISVQDQLTAEAWCACEMALVHLTEENFLPSKQEIFSGQQAPKLYCNKGSSSNQE